MKQIHIVEVNITLKGCIIENSDLQLGAFLMLWFIDNSAGKDFCKKISKSVEP